MKKLLAILGSLTVTVGGAASVVACGQKDEKEDTGSVFLDPNGELKIDSEALMRWYLEHKGLGLGNNIKQLKEFFQLFAVGILKESQKGENSMFKDIIPTTEKYSIENLQETLEKKWGTSDSKNSSDVQGAANLAWKKKEDERKKSVGEKNWKKNLTNELAGQFPYVKKDFETLKKAYINNEILTGKENKYSALTALTEILTLDNRSYSKDILQNQNTRASVTTITNIFYEYWEGHSVPTLADEIYDYVQAIQNKKENKYLNLVNLINATGGTATNIANRSDRTQDPQEPKWDLSKVDWLKSDDNQRITKDLVTDLLYRLDTTYYLDKNSGSNVKVTQANFRGSHTVANKWWFVTPNGNLISSSNTYFDLISSYPNADFENSSPNNESLFGWLTNSQKFIVDQYFQTQKPVSISEVVFKKSTDGKLEENIIGQNFLAPSNGEPKWWTQFYGLYDFLQNYVVGEGENQPINPGIISPIKGTSQYNFDTIFGNATKNKNGQILLKGIKQNNNQYWLQDFFTTKNDNKLLTLSDSEHSKITKYSVYDFLQMPTVESNDVYKLSTNSNGLPDNPTSQNLIDNLREKWNFTDPNIVVNIATSIFAVPENNSEGPGRKTVIDSLYATLNLIEQLNRKKTSESSIEYSTSDNNKQIENKVYQVLNKEQGIIAFVDTDGLHITKINGYDILKAPEAEDTQRSTYFKSNEINYINEANAFKKLNEYINNDKASGNYRYIFQDYSGQIHPDDSTPPSGSDEFTERLISRSSLNQAANYGVDYRSLNQAITNKYERFLVNNSILPGKGQKEDSQNPPFYLFNLIEEAQNSVNANQDSNDKLSKNSSWLWDYVKNLLGLNSDKDLLKAFMKFESDDNQLGPDLEEWYLDKIELSTKHTQMSGWKDFKSGWDEWLETIEKTKKDNWTENKNLPLMKLAYGDIDESSGELKNKSHLGRIDELAKFKPFYEPVQPPTSLKMFINENEWENKIANYSFDIFVGNYVNFALNYNKKGGQA